MSSFEYYDLFLKSQNYGLYHMFTFDLKDSKKMNNEDRLDAMNKMKFIMNELYNYLKDLEQKTNKKILLDNSLIENELWMPNEPFSMADTFEITIYRDSISNEMFYALFDNFKSMCNFNYDLHIADGYYETNKWIEGQNKLSRSYCFAILSNYHKKEVQKNLKK